MALSTSSVFEVRTAGSDNNGGGYVTGSSGTDFSQQNASQFALTGLTTTIASATIATTSAAASMVGNMINITGGTNFTTGIYQILSVVAGTSITVDRNATTAAGLIGTGNIGGAYATPAKLLTVCNLAGMTGWMAAGTYTITTGLTTTGGVTAASGFARIEGYNTARGDLSPYTGLTLPLLKLGAAVTLLTDGNGGYRFENLAFDGNSTTGQAITITGAYTTVFNSTVKNFSPAANQTVQLGGTASNLIQCELANIGGNQSAIYCNGSGHIINCYVHDNTTTAFFGLVQLNAFNFDVDGTIFANNTGAGCDAIHNNFIMGSVRRCTFYNNARDGIQDTTNYNLYGEISNNIFVSNGGVGLNMSVMSPGRQDSMIHHNAFFGNTSGSYSGILAGVGDIAMTANPFIGSSSGNFALNNTPGAGLAIRAAGFPGRLISGGTGFSDIGALQHQDAERAYTFVG